MWKLNKVGHSILEQYVLEMLPALKKGIKNKLSPKEVHILIPNIGTSAENQNILKELLTAEPEQLAILNASLMSQLIRGYSETELIDFQEAKAAGKKLPRHIKLIKKYGAVIQRLKDAFNYDSIIKDNADRSYRLTEMKGTNVCTYCNRQYVFTVNEPCAKGLKHIVRPELDHWYCQELYPLLSLSFYNLIPSCHICNSTVKRNAVFSLATHVNPYLQQDADPAIQFRPTLVSGNHTKYSVVIDRVASSREDNTVKAFALDEIYAVQGSLEVDDLMRFNNSYSTGYLQILFSQILNNFCPTMTKSEVYRMLFGTELEPDRFCERPLSKLKYDILKYLRVI